jgi:hypothetical protein
MAHKQERHYLQRNTSLLDRAMGFAIPHFTWLVELDLRHPAFSLLDRDSLLFNMEDSIAKAESGPRE